MSPLDRAHAAVKRLKVFPLPAVVLFPGSAMPLNIFEPRYREMVRDALATDSVFAMACVAKREEMGGVAKREEMGGVAKREETGGVAKREEAGGVAGGEGDAAVPGRGPMLKPIITVGHIVLHEPQPDGRVHLLLGGLSRARVLRELPTEKLYREVEAELLLDVPTTAETIEVQLQQSLLELTQRLPADVAARVLKVASRTHGGALADVVANTVVSDVERRYAVLATVDVVKRMNLVLEEVSALMVQLKPRAPSRGADPSKPTGYLN